jgi:hypothetical protein
LNWNQGTICIQGSANYHEECNLKFENTFDENPFSSTNWHHHTKTLYCQKNQDRSTMLQIWQEQCGNENIRPINCQNFKT